MKASRVRIISFSGIDGAGKTTQIEALTSWLVAFGQTVSVLRMWDDVVVGARLREFASSRFLRGDQGVGSPEHPLERRDKNVTSWLLRVFRYCLYLVDACSLTLRIYQIKAEKGQDFVIFDRYIYDELANLPLNRRFAHRFARFVLGFTPEPDVAYIVDAEAEAARTRKPEYPLEFLRSNRESYLALAGMLPNLIVIPGSSIYEAGDKIRSAICRRFIVGNPGEEAAETQILSPK